MRTVIVNSKMSLHGRRRSPGDVLKTTYTQAAAWVKLGFVRLAPATLPAKKAAK